MRPSPDDSTDFADIERDFLRDVVGVADFEWVALDELVPGTARRSPVRGDGDAHLHGWSTRGRYEAAQRRRTRRPGPRRRRCAASHVGYDTARAMHDPDVVYPVRTLQRGLDEAGIPTVSITQIPSITRISKPSLACFVAHPFGLTLGGVGDQSLHERSCARKATDRSHGKFPARHRVPPPCAPTPDPRRSPDRAATSSPLASTSPTVSRSPSPCSHPAHVTELFPDTVRNLLDHDGEADVQLAGRIFRVRKQLLDDAGLAGRHRFLADVPIGVGDDTGPKPYDLLLARLGTCTSMTVRMYADRKGFPLEGVEVRLTHDRIHAEDCADCESTSGLIDTVERTIELRSPLTEDQRRQLLAIADRCPVHRTLTNEIRIRTTLLHGDAVADPQPAVP